MPAAVDLSRKLMPDRPFMSVRKSGRLSMSQLYFPNEQEIRQSTPVGVRPDDPRFIVAANIVAGWLLDIVGPLFWAALIVMFVFAEMSPH
ncbi:MAG TPA: hypothetical protein VN900_14165 [Stellaceae bacterium]|jgi:hypothetical protein|nr:hypothetical protein [Stellaceae bacterium]